MIDRFRASSIVALVLAVGFAIEAEAQDTGFTWDNSTELSWVSTGGNASSSTLGVKATLTGTGGPNQFKIELGGIRSQTDLTSRTATGTPGSFTVNETVVSQLTAENYFFRGRYDREFEEAYTFAGAGWARNTFAGIQNRYRLVAGLGRTLVDAESGHLKADVGGTYTIQKDVDPAPGADEGFGGVQFSVDATRSISASTDYETILVLDQNLENTDDTRADWINSLSVTLSENLALKTSVQILFDNQPALIGVPLFDTGGTPTGTEVLTPGDKVDNILTLTLVIKL